MKTCILFLFLGIFSIMDAQNTNYRNLIESAENDEAKAKFLLNSVSSEYSNTQKPIYLALRGIGNFFMAKHAGNPFSKLSYFNKGKKDLDSAVKNDPDNLEIRFLRYATQKELPKFLGYNGHLQEDLAFLKENYKKSKDQELINQIKNYIN